MLDNKVFLQGINYLKANYINWAFDINNDLMLKVWYKKFSNLDATTFMGIIEKFTEFNKFPPNSPAELMEVLRTQLTQNQLSPLEAWEEIRRLIHKHGFYYGAKQIYDELEARGNQALLKTVQQMEGELRGLMTDDTYTPQRFQKAYEINLKREVEASSSLLLGTSNVLLLK